MPSKQQVLGHDLYLLSHNLCDRSSQRRFLLPEAPHERNLAPKGFNDWYYWLQETLSSNGIISLSTGSLDFLHQLICFCHLGCDRGCEKFRGVDDLHLGCWLYVDPVRWRKLEGSKCQRLEVGSPWWYRAMFAPWYTDLGGGDFKHVLSCLSLLRGECWWNLTNMFQLAA